MRPAGHPLALPFTGATGLASLLTLVEASTPGRSYWAVALALYWAALAVALAWLSRPAPGRRARATWMIGPLALTLGTVLLVKVDAPLHARFGFAYSPRRAPGPLEGGYEHFKGPWYIWSEGP